MCPDAEGYRDRGVVLVIEHDAAVAELARRYLERECLSVRLAGNLAGAVAALAVAPPAVMVLDLTMPGLTRGSVRRGLPVRGQSGAPQLICLEGPGGLRPQHLGLARDGDWRCLRRPFSPRLLTARVQAAMRHAVTGTPSTGATAATPGVASVASVASVSSTASTPRTANSANIPSTVNTASTVNGVGTANTGGVATIRGTYGGPVLDAASRMVRFGAVEARLTETEFTLLAFLTGNAGRAFTRQQLLDAAWGGRGAVTARAVDVQIAGLRAKLGARCPIRTVRGVGYAAVAAPGNPGRRTGHPPR